MSHWVHVSPKKSLALLLFALASVAAFAAQEKEQRGFAPNQVYQLGEIDAVNVSNGDVLIRIPIGQEYSVGPTLKYRFGLSYNSKVWDVHFSGAVPDDPNADQRWSTPEENSNAGFGWILSLGKLAIEREGERLASLVYIAPDGAEFRFHAPTSDPNDPSDPTLMYAFSGQYLRLRKTGDPHPYKLEFPRGETHTFDAGGNLRRMEDQFGNWVKVDVEADANGRTLRWEVTDGYADQIARTHYVSFTADSGYTDRSRVDQVDLEAFDAQRALYTFGYTENAPVGYGGGGSTDPRPCIQQPLLTSVLQEADDSSYTAQYKTIPTERCADDVQNDDSGVITSLTLPAHGSIEWTHGDYEMNVSQCYSPVIGWLQPFLGVTTRRYKDHKGQVVSTWAYKPSLTPTSATYFGKICNSTTNVLVIDPSEEFVNVVESPGGLVTKHYFSAWPNVPYKASPGGFDPDEMGLPFTRKRSYGGTGRFLSTEIYDCSVDDCPDRDADGTPRRKPVRRTYVSYARQPLLHNDAPMAASLLDMRPFMVTGQLTEFEIDPETGVGAYYTDTTFAAHDGYGHFTNTVTKSNFESVTGNSLSGGTNSKTSQVERLRTIDSDTWLLEMVGNATIEQDGVTSQTKTEFDLNTGFRKSVRTFGLAGAEQSSDLLTVFCRDTNTLAGLRGFVTSERFVGGERAGIPENVCSPAVPSGSSGHYFLTHDYTFTGASLFRHTAQWAGTTFHAADEEFDLSSGLVEATRDISELKTTYEYDALGRLVKVVPTGQAWTKYTYDRASNPVRVHAEMYPENSTSGLLKDDHYFYDGQGRLIQSKNRLPGASRWAAAVLEYDEAGRVKSSSVPMESTGPGYEEGLTATDKTQSSYDVFGRPTKVIAPDGSKTYNEYVSGGTRMRDLSFEEALATEKRKRSTEQYDGFGRLAAVTERSKNTDFEHLQGGDVTTLYSYDVADRLTRVLTRVLTSDGTIEQKRLFEYDLRGWLKSETHPEKGSAGNGIVEYQNYDARGHAELRIEGESQDPKFTTKYAYDAAERLTSVRDGADLPIKEFEFASENDGANRRMGKLLHAKRYNRVTAGTFLVTETYAYNAAGRVAQRDTRVDKKTESGLTEINTFTQTYEYDPHYGLPDRIGYPTLKFGNAAVANGIGLLSQSFDRGVLNAVNGFATFTYHPNGMLHEVRRTQGPAVDTYAADRGMARPASIRFSGLSGCALIRRQPQSVTLTAWNETATFDTEVAAGTTVQWYEGARPDTSRPVSTGTTFTTGPITSPKSYWARVTTADGTCSEDSATVVASVCAPPVITAPAADVTSTTTLAIGESVQLAVTATGASLSYAWLRQVGDQAPTEVGTGSTFVFTAVAADEPLPLIRIIVRVSNGACGTEERIAATFDVATNVATTPCVARFVTALPPTSRVSQRGELDKSTVTLESVEGATSYSFKWYHEDDPTPFQIDDENPTPTSSHWANIFEDSVIRVVAEVNCPTGKSSPVTSTTYGFVQGYCPELSVNVEPPAIVTGSQPVVTFTAQVSWPEAAYQWYSGESGNTRSPVPNGQSNTLTVNAAAGTYWVRVREDDCGTFVDSSTVTVEEPGCAPVRLHSEPQDVMSIAAGTPTALSVNASALTGTLTYQWIRDEGTYLTGQTTATTTQAPIRTTDYWVLVKNGCNTAYSRKARVHVTSCADINILEQPADVSVMKGQAVTLGIQATSVAPLRYRWYLGDSGDTTLPIEGATGPTLNIPVAVEQKYWVRLFFDDPNACAVDSRTVAVAVCSTPVLVGQPSHSNTNVPGSIQSLSIHVDGDHLTYRWFEGMIGDESKPQVSISPIAHVKPIVTTNYWVKVTSDCAPPLQDQVFQVGPVTASVCPKITTQPAASKTIVMPGTTTTITLQAQRADKVEWYVGASPSTWTKVSEGTSLTYTTAPVTQNTTYWARVHSGRCYVDSEPVVVNLCQLPPITWSPQNLDKVEKGTFQNLRLIYVPADQPVTYAWYRGQAGDTSNLFSVQAVPGITPTETTTYWARVTIDDTGCHVDLPPFTVRVCIPKITTQPAPSSILDKTSNPSAYVRLTVAADLPDSTYQWYAGQPGDTTTPISGATASSYDASPNADLTYWVRVKGSCDIARDSNAASVTLCLQPAITQQPRSSVTTAGTTTQIGVTATGTELAYQWYKGAAGNTTTPIGTTREISVTQSATTDYWVRITGRCGTAGSNTARLSVAPSITIQPAGGPITNGTSRTLSVAASGTFLSYKWYRRSGTTDTEIAGATSTSYTTPPITSDTTYFCRVFSGAAYRDSNLATLTVCQPRAVTLSPWTGVSGAEAILNISGATAGETYEWYRGQTGDTSAPMGTGTTLKVYPLQSTDYWARTKRTGCDADSAAVKVQVCYPKITTQPQGSVTSSGTQKTLTVAATGTPPLTYRWYVGPKGSTTSPIAGATSASYTTPSLSATTTYWARVTGGQQTCGTHHADSESATITVCNAPVISSLSATQYIQSGSSATIKVIASGTNLTYQWYIGTPGVTTTPVPGGTTSVISVSPSSTTSYWVQIKSEGYCVTNSGSVTVDVCTTPVITTQPQSRTILSGQSATLTVATSATGASYQWYQGAPGTTTTPLGTAATITVTPAADTQYWARITRGACTANSAGATITVCKLTASVANVNAASGQSATLTATVTNARVTPTYTWYQGTSGNTSVWAGSGQQITVSRTATTSYWVRVTDGTCTVDSNTATLNVCVPTITAQPQSAMVTSGQSKTLTVTASASPLTYQWYVGDSGVTTSPISGATSSSYTTPALTTATKYWVRVTGCSSVNSATATVSICNPPAAPAPTNSGNAVPGEQASVSIAATGTGLTYQWYKGQSGDTTRPISGGTSATYAFTVQASEYYWVRVSGTCGTTNSPATLHSVVPTITSQPLSTAVPYGSSATLSVAATGNFLTYQWYQNYLTSPIAGATGPAYVTPAVTGNATYYVRVTSGNVYRTSAAATVSICTGPSVSLSSSSLGNHSWNLRVNRLDPEEQETEYQWYIGTPGNPAQSTPQGGLTTIYYKTVTVTSSQTWWARVWFLDHSCYTDTPGRTIY